MKIIQENEILESIAECAKEKKYHITEDEE
jgi:hypothetical protein